MELTSGSIIVTHSDIKAFLTCRRAWAWSYVHDFKAPEKRTGPLALGTRVHAALEHYYRTGKDPIAEHDRLAREDAEWIEDNGPGWAQDTIYDDMIVGRNCVTAHQEWLADTGADARFTVFSVEEVTEVEFIPGVVLRTKADVVLQDIETEFLYINDFKTDGGWGGSPRETLERSWQPTTYGISTALKHPERIIDGAFFTVLKKVKRPERASTPLVERFRVPGFRHALANKRAALEQICRDMVETMERIETDGSKHAYPTPTAECKWCDFKHPCELVDESPAAARAMLDANFIRGGRHARYE